MGSHPYFYFTEYQPNVNIALQALRKQEFEAGRYDPTNELLQQLASTEAVVWSSQADSASVQALSDLLVAAKEASNA